MQRPARLGLSRSERSQAFDRAGIDAAFLIAHGADMRQYSDFVMSAESPSIFMADIAFTNVARQDVDFLRRAEISCFTPTHMRVSKEQIAGAARPKDGQHERFVSGFMLQQTRHSCEFVFAA
jgi:hypothetical protein